MAGLKLNQPFASPNNLPVFRYNRSMSKMVAPCLRLLLGAMWKCLSNLRAVLWLALPRLRLFRGHIVC